VQATLIGSLRSRPCQSAFLDDKGCDSINTFAALQIGKNEGRSETDGGIALSSVENEVSFLWLKRKALVRWMEVGDHEFPLGTRKARYKPQAQRFSYPAVTFMACLR
jgi:hypothetical protein